MPAPPASILAAALAMVVALATAPAAGYTLPAPPGFGPDRNIDRRSGEQLVPVRVTADVRTIHPGERIHLAFVFGIDRGWHIYWVNPGDAGIPTRIDVTAPPGFEVGPVQYPRPLVIEEPDGTCYGYERGAVLFVPVTAPAVLPESEVTFASRVSWLVCKKICKMGSAQPTIALAATNAPRPDRVSPATPDPAFQWKARLPRPLADLPDATVTYNGRTLTASGRCPGHDRVAIYPIETPGVIFGRSATVIEDGLFGIVTEVEVTPANALGEPMAVKGIVVLGEKPTDPCYAFEVPLGADGRAAPPKPAR